MSEGICRICARGGLQLSLGHSSRLRGIKGPLVLGSSCMTSYSNKENGLVSFLSPMLSVSDQGIKHGVSPPSETIKKKRKSWRGPTRIFTANSLKCLMGSWVGS